MRSFCCGSISAKSDVLGAACQSALSSSEDVWKKHQGRVLSRCRMSAEVDSNRGLVRVQMGSSTRLPSR
jgi:hypothetical protein